MFFCHVFLLYYVEIKLNFNPWQVHGPGVDIDTLCVGPSYVNREVNIAFRLFFLWVLWLLISILHLIFICLNQEDFFFILHNILAEMEEVTELQPIPEAHVPVMKFKFDGLSIDLLYASISLLVVPEVSSVQTKHSVNHVNFLY